MDYLYLVADVYLKSGRLIHSIVDRTLLLVGMTDRIDRYKVICHIWSRFQGWVALPT